MTQDLHVVLGATGGVGAALTRELVDRGLLCRAVSRSGGGGVPGAEPFAADLTGPDALRAAVSGAAVVYHAAQPAYTRWAAEFPAMTRTVVDAAAAAGAKLVMVDNLYMYGAVPGGHGPGTAAGPLTERTPHRARGAKGRVRAAMAAELLDAHAAGRLRVTIGRLADYYGPGGVTSAVGAELFEGALAGRTATWFGSADHLHTFIHLPDAAHALVTLGTEAAADGRAWHLPSAPPLTPREFVGLVQRAAGAPERMRVVPAWAVRAAGIVNPMARELAELAYQVRAPFVVDHSAFDAQFGSASTQAPTPHETAVERTVAWFADRRARDTARLP
ncbi:MAG TPA: NAD-dependent epimerase/dehydratase family protein [Pseudonocardia sp.]|nr:NAD-dependent epimerase/dehydratase family protein [Pseudonocardia sp.]